MFADQVMHSAERKGGLIAGVELPPTYDVPVPSKFVERPSQQRQCTERTRMIVQISDWFSNPIDQPYVEFVVGVQPDGPVAAIAKPAEGQMAVETTA